MAASAAPAVSAVGSTSGVTTNGQWAGGSKLVYFSAPGRTLRIRHVLPPSITMDYLRKLYGQYFALPDSVMAGRELVCVGDRSLILDLDTIAAGDELAFLPAAVPTVPPTA